jgi:hypothetical protein
VIYKVKDPGEPVETFTAQKLAKEQPALHEQVRTMPLGSKRIVKLRENKRIYKIGVHKLHPNELSPKARAKVCGPGLTGEARRLFIEEGLTLKEQQEAGRLQAEMELAQVIADYKAAHPLEYEAKERRKAARQEIRAEERAKKTGRKRIDLTGLVTPKQLADRAELSPLEIRKFLRMKNIGKRGGRYAFQEKEAVRIIAAAKKHYQED